MLALYRPLTQSDGHKSQTGGIAAEKIDLSTKPMADMMLRTIMATANNLLVFGINASKRLLNSLTADLKGGEWEHRAVPGSNCTAWLVGHLIMTDRWALGMAGVTELPELPAGFETVFSRENNAPHAATFGDPASLVPTFDQHRDLLADAIAKMPGTRFDEPTPKPHPRFSTMGEFFYAMNNHVVMHCGQISTIRRSLGRSPLF